MSAASRRSRARLTATADETTTTDESRAFAGPDAPRRRRRTLQPRAIATIALAWMLLWDRVSWGNLVNGVLVGLFVTLAFPLPSIEFQGRLRPHRVVWLIVLFLADLVAASWQVLRLALGRRRPRNAVIEVQLRSRSDFYLTLTAELVALVPGSVVVDARRSTSVLYLHLLDIERQGAIEHQRRHVLAVEERVVRAFGSREEIAHLEQAKGATP
ncbi:Na+/H+ antiporter subunit E [Humibacillus xanthopallidus]|uniref:Multisubunit sodium/proton antiporter MrpE subunit n=1 Tax=Humibacillus xanthopallidus TaxID=412689 RepID=A0A543I0G1_9MICO|nr:Na+/H+ antiporter subunit E [Humibacillus xanthopallidus]TQM64086.1 multisubunit sodium/proton antiporter MrpE subunit [Humibacillus xanthopallidus]